MCFKGFFKPDSRKMILFAIYFAISLLFILMSFMIQDFPPPRTTTVIVTEAITFVVMLGSSLLTLLLRVIAPSGVGMANFWVVFIAFCAAQAVWGYIVSCAIVSVYQKLLKKQ